MAGLSASQADILAPLAVGLPDGPVDSYFNPEQWATLLAILDTVIPSIRRESTTEKKKSQLTVSDVEYNAAVDHLKINLVNSPDSESLDEYLDENCSDNPQFQSLLKRYLIHYARDDARSGLAFILSTLKWVELPLNTYFHVGWHEE